MAEREAMEVMEVGDGKVGGNDEKRVKEELERNWRFIQVDCVIGYARRHKRCQVGRRDVEGKNGMGEEKGK